MLPGGNLPLGTPEGFPGMEAGFPKANRRWFPNFVMGLFGFGLFLAVSGGFFSSFVLLPAAPGRQAVADVVRIPPGASTREIGRILEDKGIIRSADYFVWVSRAAGVDGRLQAGDYELSPGMNLLAILRRLEQGEIASVRVTIPEGMNARDIGRVLQQRGLADAASFHRRVMEGRDLVADILPFPLPVASVEGYLYPDTYRFPPHIDEEEIIRRMVARFVHEAYPLVAEGSGRVGLTPHEIVTLASIVEKEAMRDEERALIAGVFFNRLAVNQPLQADPTVQYVMEAPRARLYLQDLAIDSPYNTYRYRGLPPGPIASPGLASLRATIEPADTPYMYFVAKGDGTHIFSTTFAEHVEARRRVGR